MNENEQKEYNAQPSFAVDLKAFPMEALPPNLRQFTEAVSASVQVSPDMVAVPLLATLCVPLQNRFLVRIDSTYTEPLCLYTLTIARPSERKSAIMSILERPLWNYQSEQNKTLEQTFAETQSGAKKRGVTLYVTDATPEKLARLMEENHGSIALLSDEPDALAVAAGLRYGKSKNLGLMLQAWSAGHVMIQRATEDRRISIDRAVMSVAVMSQPSFVEALIKDKEMSARGFMQRFLYAQPLSRVGSRSFIKPEIPQTLLDEYQEIITDFLMLSTDELREIRLSKGAKVQAELYFTELESKIGENPALEGWMGKLFGQFLRIAGVLHCSLWGPVSEKHEIEWNTMVNARKIAEYFRSHAVAVFSDIDVPEDVLFARELYRKLVINNVTDFTKNDLRKLTGGNLPKEAVRLALASLVHAGYLGVIGKGETVEAKVESKGAAFTVLAVRQKAQNEADEVS